MLMKTYKQFVTEARELDEGLGTIAKVAIKGALKLGKKILDLKYIQNLLIHILHEKQFKKELI